MIGVLRKSEHPLKSPIYSTCYFTTINVSIFKRVLKLSRPLDLNMSLSGVNGKRRLFSLSKGFGPSVAGVATEGIDAVTTISFGALLDGVVMSG